MSRQRKLIFVAAVAASIALFAQTSNAQQTKRTELKKSDLTGTNMEVIIGVTEAPVGTFLPKHIHYGEEVVYILEGAMTEVPGQPPEVRQAGTASVNAREVPHAGYKVVGDKPLKFLTVHVVDKGKPLTVVVKE